MAKNQFYISLLKFLFCLCSIAQTKNLLPQKKADTVYCDCEYAWKINLSSTKIVGPTVPPKGAGKQEIKNAGRKNAFVFDKEHNSAWYKITTQTAGKLSYIITPLNKKNDYDFILYKSSDPKFCENFSEFQNKPERSNICRGDTSIQGTTGLISTAKNNFEKQGKESSWSNTIEVAKGDVFYLLLDNVYEKGEGHTIEFFIKEAVEVNGFVLDEKNKPVDAEITLNDKNGNLVLQTQSDKNTGKYSINAELIRGEAYNLTFLGEANFIVSKFVTSDSLKKQELITTMQSLKVGEKYKLKNINFYGDSPQFLPYSTPTVEALYKMMKKNKKISIQLEGHVNGCAHGQKDGQKLSEERAAAIMNYLTKKGISNDRIKTIGYGCSKMLFPRATNEAQQQENRRVEVKLLEF